LNNQTSCDFYAFIKAFYHDPPRNDRHFLRDIIAMVPASCIMISFDKLSK